MKKNIFLFIIHCSRVAILAPLLIANCYPQWLQQTSGVSTSLLDIDFINQNTGWASGDNGVIVKTTNGGLNWIPQLSGVSKRLEGIDAVDVNTLYCVGWDETILKTTDGGNNWIAIRNGPPMQGGSFFKVFFLNANTGWILRNNYIMRTFNGCLTFDSSYVIYTYLRDIYFKDAQTGVLCGDGALIMKSTNGGVTWVEITIPLYNFEEPDFYRLSIVNNNFGWTVGGGDNSGLGKLVYRTTNFGTSWDTIGRVPYPNNELNYSVFFPSLNTGYCGGTTGYTFKTTNGGFNWIQQVVPSNGFRRDFNFINDSLGWSVGGGGQIYITTNGGTYVGVEPISNEIPQDFKLGQNYPNPFNTETIIEFAVTERTYYRLEIFDVLGKKVDEIMNKFLNVGEYKISYNAGMLSSGTYFYKLSSTELQQTRKLILIK